MPSASITSCPRVVGILACVALSYVLAGAAYLVTVRVMKLGSPFMDSLTAEQREIYKQSREQRRRIFYGSLAPILLLTFVVYYSMAK